LITTILTATCHVVICDASNNVTGKQLAHITTLLCGTALVITITVYFSVISQTSRLFLRNVSAFWKHKINCAWQTTHS